MKLGLGITLLRHAGTLIKDILWGNLHTEDGYNLLQEDGHYLLWEGY